jgi:hypothetical protein
MTWLHFVFVKSLFVFVGQTRTMEPQPPEFGQKRQVETHAGEPLVFEVRPPL